MDRRLFLKLTGLVAAASAMEALPASAESLAELAVAERARALPAVTSTVAPRIAVRERGTYQINGVVQLEQPVVEITGAGATQRISRGGSASDTVPFTSYVTFTGPGLTPEITVTGGRVVSLDVTPLMLA
jgi:hypothetical protein